MFVLQSLQHTTTHCNTLQHTWSVVERQTQLTLQHTATHCNTLQHNTTYLKRSRQADPAHTATHCNTLQHTTTWHTTTYLKRSRKADPAPPPPPVPAEFYLNNCHFASMNVSRYKYKWFIPNHVTRYLEFIPTHVWHESWTRHIWLRLHTCDICIHPKSCHTCDSLIHPESCYTCDSLIHPESCHTRDSPPPWIIHLSSRIMSHA